MSLSTHEVLLLENNSWARVALPRIVPPHLRATINAMRCANSVWDSSPAIHSADRLVFKQSSGLRGCLVVVRRRTAGETVLCQRTTGKRWHRGRWMEMRNRTVHIVIDRYHYPVYWKVSKELEFLPAALLHRFVPIDIDR